MASHATAAPSTPLLRDKQTESVRRRDLRRLRCVLNLEEFEEAARSRLPRAVHGYVAGGADDGSSIRENRRAFAEWHMVPRILRDVSDRSQRISLFGRSFDSPFAIAPMGASAVVSFDADRRMARIARAMNIPYVLSANSVTPMEDIARINPDSWFAAYQQPDPENIRQMCARVAATGLKVFVLTVDVAVGSNRENNVRSGYTMPLRPSVRLTLDVIRHPRWLAGTLGRTVLRRGIPTIDNIDPSDRPTIFSRKLGGVTGHAAFSWKQAELIRHHWKGPFILKGILSPEDARIARESGVDGIVVSNHGGRQLDGAATAIEMLPDIKAQSGSMTVIADSGFRRGTDVLKGLVLGADCIMIGRPFLYAAALAGEAGLAHAIGLLRKEIDTDMALMGMSTLDEPHADLLRRRPTARQLFASAQT